MIPFDGALGIQNCWPVVLLVMGICVWYITLLYPGGIQGGGWMVDVISSHHVKRNTCWSHYGNCGIIGGIEMEMVSADIVKPTTT